MRRRFEILWSKAEKHKVEHFLLMSAKKAEKETRERNLLGSLQTSIPEQKIISRSILLL